MMATQKEMTERTKAKLREAAVDSICEVGYTRTTGVEIARRAGVTRGALHHHYPRGKVDVCLDIIYTSFKEFDDRYEGQQIDYDAWLDGRMRYLTQTYDEKSLRETWVTLNIIMFIDVEDQEVEELRSAHEARGLQSLDLRYELVMGTEDQKRKILPIYQFLQVFFTGYMIHKQRLQHLDYADGAMAFARELLDVWIEITHERN
jgi:AcrR family transcriptional regulator